MNDLIRFFFAGQPVRPSLTLSCSSVSESEELSCGYWGLGPCAARRADQGISHPGVEAWAIVVGGGKAGIGIGIESWSPVSGSFSRRGEDPDTVSLSAEEACSHDMDFWRKPLRAGRWDVGLLLRRSEYWSRIRGRVKDHHRDAPSGFVWNDCESEVFGCDCGW